MLRIRCFCPYFHQREQWGTSAWDNSFGLHPRFVRKFRESSMSQNVGLEKKIALSREPAPLNIPKNGEKHTERGMFHISPRNAVNAILNQQDCTMSHKKVTFIFTITTVNIDQFNSLFTVNFRKDLRRKKELKLPPPLKSVATLPCEM